MRTIYIHTTTILAIAVFGLAACSPRSDASQLNSTQGGGIPSAPTSPVKELCANPLAPVKLGSAWTYSASGDAFSTFTFTSTITDVRLDGFTLTSKLDDGTVLEQDWACKPEGLVALA